MPRPVRPLRPPGKGGPSALVEASDPGADSAAAQSADAAQSAAAQVYREEERAGSGNVLIGYGTSEGAGRRRRRIGRRGATASSARSAGSPAADSAPVLTTAFGERGGADLLPQVPDAPGAVGVTPDGRAIRVISPLVRRLAAERGIDLSTLTPSGPGGVITRRDVDEAPASPAMSPESGLSGAGAYAAESSRAVDHHLRGTVHGVSADGTRGHAAPDVRTPLTGVRAMIADKLTRSHQELPAATTWVDVDASGLLAWRDDLRAGEPDARIGVLALLARITVAALARHPELNASVEGREIVQHGAVHLSVAMQSPRGLMVPVIHDAHAMTTRQLAAALRELTDGAMAGTLTPAQLTGGTFTLNNFGGFGVDGATPLLNHPEAGMIGVGRILDRPWAVDGGLQVRPITNVSLTFDHRVCDGGTAGGLLRYVADCIERPGTLLADA